MQRSASLLRSVRPLVSPSATLQLSRQVSSIPSTSTTAEGIRQHGIDGFLPKESFENVEQWIGGLWNRLEGEMNSNETLKSMQATRSQRNQPFDILSLLTETARNPSCTVAFNSASSILNGSFFLERLTRTGAQQQVPSDFRPVIDHLEDHLVGRARGMSGSGFLWLVKMKPAGDKKFRYDIVPTYGAGTILVRNRLMLGRDAQKELFRPTEPEPSSETPTSSNGKSGESETTTEPAIDSAHHRIHPLACVSLHEHVYMPKYGVNGKEDYVRDWLKYVDWNTIASS